MRQMTRSSAIAILAALALIVTSAPSVFAGADLDAARSLVKAQNLGRNFQEMVLTVVPRTETFHMAGAKVGPVTVAQLLKKHMDEVLPKYQAAWDENLASAYAQNFTAKELLSLSQDGQRSPYFPALTERQAAVGATMRRLSEGILKDATSEIVGGVYTEAFASK